MDRYLLILTWVKAFDHFGASRALCATHTRRQDIPTTITITDFSIGTSRAAATAAV